MLEKKFHLQGLRAVAISAVLLFHFFPEYFPNGYLGVDQFFLVSGYLMTMMMNRYKQSNFLCNYFDFLYRRGKRIAPLYYLATLITLEALYFVPNSAIQTNVQSAIWAVLFSTNLIRPDGLEGYAEKLGIGVDCFTHTWSLALEMQFYLFFPLIFIVSHGQEKKPMNFVSILIASASFLFHILADSFLSFNCVFSRIWQFLAGMAIYDKTNVKKKNKVLLEEEILEKIDQHHLFCLLAVVMTISLILFPLPIDPLYSRVNVVLLTAIIVYTGDNYWLLENETAVYVGDTSYVLYLVHWPVVAQLKMNGLTTPYYMFLGLLGSFLISVVVHHLYEKRYIVWKKAAIITAVVILLFANVVEILVSIEPTEELLIGARTMTNSSSTANVTFNNYFFESDYLGRIIMGYENKTNEERAQLNEAFDTGDGEQLDRHPCEKMKPHHEWENRCRVSRAKGLNSTLLVIGNSYALNMISVINDECCNRFNEIFLSATSTCEPLFHTKTNYRDCLGKDEFFLKVVEEIKPDVLIIVTRHVESKVILNGTTMFDDYHFNTAIDRLQHYERFVKKDIYIMDQFIEPKQSMSKQLNAYLRKGIGFNDTSIYDIPLSYVIAKERMARLASCKKCCLFDIASQFFHGDSYKLYDPQYFVAYFTKGIHLSPAGLERVRPLFRRICSKF